MHFKRDKHTLGTLIVKNIPGTLLPSKIVLEPYQSEKHSWFFKRAKDVPILATLFVLYNKCPKFGRNWSTHLRLYADLCPFTHNYNLPGMLNVINKYADFHIWNRYYVVISSWKKAVTLSRMTLWISASPKAFHSALKIARLVCF